MRTSLLLLLTALLISGCAIRQSNPGNLTKSPQSIGIQQFSGHWSTGPAYSWFTPLGTDTRYWIDPTELPKEASDFLQTQPAYQTRDGPEGSIFVTLDGYLTPVSPLEFPNQPSFQQLHVRKVNGFHAANKDFLGWRKNGKYAPAGAQQIVDGKVPEATHTPH